MQLQLLYAPQLHDAFAYSSKGCMQAQKEQVPATPAIGCTWHHGGRPQETVQLNNTKNRIHSHLRMAMLDGI